MQAVSSRCPSNVPRSLLPGPSGNCPAGCGDSSWPRSWRTRRRWRWPPPGCRCTCMTSRYSASCWRSAWPRWSSPGAAGEPAGLIKDLHAVWYLPAALLLPPLYGLIAMVPILVLSQLRIRRALVYRRAFTAAAIGLSLGAASLTFHAALRPLGASLSGSPSSQLRWVLLAACCAALRTLINKAPGRHRGEGIGADGEPAPAGLGPRGRLQRRRRAVPVGGDRVRGRARLAHDRVRAALRDLAAALVPPHPAGRRGPGRRQDRAAERRDLAARGAYRGQPGGPHPYPAGRRDDGHRPLQGGQRHLRSPGRGRGAGRDLRRPARPAARLRHRGPVRRRGIRHPAPAYHRGRGHGYRRTAPARDSRRSSRR